MGTIMVIYVIAVFLASFSYVFLHIIILKMIIEKIRRSFQRSFFKANVINNIQSSLSKRIYRDVPKSRLELFNTDNINNVKDYFYDIFLRFEIAYNNLDYNMMRLLSTKELYENYYLGITLDLKAGQKKIINDVQRKKVIIFDLNSTTTSQNIYAMIEISYITYTLDKKGFVISGKRDEHVTERFEVIFRKEFEAKEIVKCPNCGATITGNKCDFCRSTIKNEEFKISSIKKIID